jgi:hypothetical protein
MDHVTLATTIVALLCPYLGELFPKPDTRIGNAAIDADDLGGWDL